MEFGLTLRLVPHNSVERSNGGEILRQTTKKVIISFAIYLPHEARHESGESVTRRAFEALVYDYQLQPGRNAFERLTHSQDRLLSGSAMPTSREPSEGMGPCHNGLALLFQQAW